jgi:adenosyl cobinamide kinase/adenosyl cobinamide phosphate guanylyltransferase
MGVHPDTTLGRRYRDVLGRVNQLWVAASSKSLLLVAGRAIELGDPGDILERGPNR